ncbi:MAG: DUF3109 family protein, partial [Bacteroidaceae bacterium]|nr:DUF3109 family protein [Bacteroidaceae bacterium]
MLPILQVGDVLLSPDILTEHFCCDLDACGGACCIEGDAGAPLKDDEVAELERVLPAVWNDLDPRAQKVLRKQGVAYRDRDGDLVTSIVGEKDCCFTCYDEAGTCLCATDRAHREGRTDWAKPISCYLYPIREKQMPNGTVALNYDRWELCRPAVRKGRELQLPLYVFLRDPLIRRFGQEWYDQLLALVD